MKYKSKRGRKKLRIYGLERKKIAGMLLLRKSQVPKERLIINEFSTIKEWPRVFPRTMDRVLLG